MNQKPLELTLREAATDGIAYFVDGSGNDYFRPRDGGPVRPLVHGKDDHPMMYQFSRRHPLAEVGRKFASLEEADHYVGALFDFTRMILNASVVTDARLSGEARRETSDFVKKGQEKIKRKHLGVLDTIPGFDKVRKYLDMTPVQINKELKAHANPSLQGIL